MLERVAADASFEGQELGFDTEGYRARRRATVESDAIADVVWARVSEHVAPIAKWFGTRAEAPRLDPPVTEWVASSSNPRSRFYRYGLGGTFFLHQDEPWKPRSGVRSFLTALVYLRTEKPCVGGETVIDGEVVSVEPGRIVVFPHALPLEGRAVEGGEKLVIRSDVIGVALRTRHLPSFEPRAFRSSKLWRTKWSAESDRLRQSRC